MATADAGMRATSLGVSAALLSAAVFVALTASISHIVIEPPWADPVPVIQITPDSPRPPVDQPQPRPVTTPLDDAPLIADTLFGADATSTDVSEVTSVGGFDLGPVLVETPNWVRRPRDLARFYPRRALAMDREGSVVLE